MMPFLPFCPISTINVCIQILCYVASYMVLVCVCCVCVHVCVHVNVSAILYVALYVYVCTCMYLGWLHGSTPECLILWPLHQWQLNNETTENSKA